MSDNYESSDRTENYIYPTARIKVIGVGNGGINAVAGMLSKLKSVEFWAIDSDIETIEQTLIPNRITWRINPEVSRESIACAIEGADLLYIVGGMGSENALAAMIVVAEVSRELGALTIGVVTRPFRFEGTERCNRATIGIEKLVTQVDTLVTISNDKLLLESDNLISNQAAFVLADNIIRSAVQSISDIIMIPGLIGTDFADVRSVLADGGLAYCGNGEGEGKSRGKDAALQAINSALLEGSIEAARGIVLSITGGADMTLSEITTAGDTVYEVVDPNANIIMGAIVDESMEGKMQVSIIAAGFSDRIQ